jgi:KDO2-lipid IV(A) lauroyltransferase
MLNYKIRANVLDNVRHVIPKSSRRLKRLLARRIIRNVVKNYYDVIRLPSMSTASLERTITMHGIEHLDNALKLGKGVIMISGHIGNYSIVAQMAATLNYPSSLVVEDIEPPILYDFVNKLRGHFGVKMIKLGSAQIRTIYKILRNNELLLLAADRDVNDEGTPTPFFDAVADMPPGPVALALRTGAALVPGYTLRLPDNTSVVIIDEAIDLERTGDRDEDLRINMRKVAQTLERYIIKAPDQWVVLQRVWDKDYTRDQGLGVRDKNGHSKEQIPPEQQEQSSIPQETNAG